MPEVSATDAARNFSDILDAVEHRGEHFTIVRRGKAVAQPDPVQSAQGAEVKALLRRHRRDPGFARDVLSARELFATVRRHGRSRGAHELIIAATAKATQRHVVSADQSAYDNLPGIVVRSHRP